jgi:hypothetical protein
MLDDIEFDGPEKAGGRSSVFAVRWARVLPDSKRIIHWDQLDKPLDRPDTCASAALGFAFAICNYLRSSQLRRGWQANILPLMRAFTQKWGRRVRRYAQPSPSDNSTRGGATASPRRARRFISQSRNRSGTPLCPCFRRTDAPPSRLGENKKRRPRRWSRPFRPSQEGR